MYGKRSGSMRLVFGAFGMKIWRCWVQNAFRTPRMDLGPRNHTENIRKINIRWYIGENTFGGTFGQFKNSSPSFVYGKQTEAHSGQCGRPINTI